MRENEEAWDEVTRQLRSLRRVSQRSIGPYDQGELNDMVLSALGHYGESHHQQWYLHEIAKALGFSSTKDLDEFPPGIAP